MSRARVRGVAGRTLNDYADEAHEANQKWWTRADGTPIERNKGELLMLMVSEIAEAMEGERKGLMDDKLPHRLMAEVELVDALVRIFDYAAAHGYDLEGAYREKMAYNASREDHKHEARALAGGKKMVNRGVAGRPVEHLTGNEAGLPDIVAAALGRPRRRLRCQTCEDFGMVETGDGDEDVCPTCEGGVWRSRESWRWWVHRQPWFGFRIAIAYSWRQWSVHRDGAV